jgi:hypothetical protein
MNWLKQVWCSWTHGGGVIKRDHLDRINWQCSKCGRWADAVSLEDECKVVEAHMKAMLKGED